MPITSYRSESFQNFLDGYRPGESVKNLYSDTELPPAEQDIQNSVSPIKKKHRIIWPLVPHSYASSYTSHILVRQPLANPFDHVKNGKNIPGSIREKHYLGTDKFGKDILARLFFGFRLSILFGLALAISSTTIGCLLGAIQGFFGGLIDLLGQRLTEIWGALPRLMLLMILGEFLSSQGDMTGFQHIILLFLIMNLTSWMGMAGHMRGMFLSARNLDYVKAAKALGASNWSIMIKHILPNSLTPIVTFLPFSISSAIMALVGLDFLGFGLNYPTPSLGELLSQGQEHLEAWWILVPTFSTLTILLILLTFIGEGVRNAFDPRYK